MYPQTCFNFGEGMTRPVASLPAYATWCPTNLAGVTASYYSDATFTTLVTTDTQSNVDINTATVPSQFGDPSLKTYSIRYTGVITVTQPGNYAFSVTYQDQFRLYINDVLIGSGSASAGGVRVQGGQQGRECFFFFWGGGRRRGGRRGATACGRSV